jgi:hypothetical protein
LRLYDGHPDYYPDSAHQLGFFRLKYEEALSTGSMADHTGDIQISTFSMMVLPVIPVLSPTWSHQPGLETSPTFAVDSDFA